MYTRSLSEFSSFKKQRDDDELSVATDYQDYDPAKHNPVFYGKMHYPIKGDGDPAEGVDVSVTHPSVIGYAFTDKPPKSPPPPPPPITPKEKCKRLCQYHGIIDDDILCAWFS